MASDSEASEADQTRWDIEKIWPCHNLLLGHSGNTSVRDSLVPAINALDPASLTDRLSALRAVAEATRPVLEWAYNNHVPAAPAGQIPDHVNGRLLIVGLDDAGYWVGEVDGH